jgi:hypothetical protein
MFYLHFAIGAMQNEFQASRMISIASGIIKIGVFPVEML